jgi:hypothetical protein
MTLFYQNPFIIAVFLQHLRTQIFVKTYTSKGFTL